MSNNEKLPKNYRNLREDHTPFMEAVEELGKTIREMGPLDDKSAHLIQLAAAIAVHSEGAVHSHVRRAVAAGASRQEVEHAIILLTSTIGFPTVSAALSWANDILKEK